jgi:hypothetical protein
MDNVHDYFFDPVYMCIGSIGNRHSIVGGMVRTREDIEVIGDCSKCMSDLSHEVLTLELCA